MPPPRKSSKSITRTPPSRKSPPPQERPLRALRNREALMARFHEAIAAADGDTGAHCIHELSMRGEMAVNVESALEQLWAATQGHVPDWLPMRHVPWLPCVYEATARFARAARGRSNIYLVLLDYRDSRDDPFGLYVGMSRYSPLDRFEQHKAGIRAAGSVLQRGLEVLLGPTLHLQQMARAEAERVEEQLAEVLRAQGLLVHGGH
jgi:hypothetical protein